MPVVMLVLQVLWEFVVPFLFFRYQVAYFLPVEDVSLAVGHW